MPKNVTYGDDRELACPACGEIQCFSDWLIDGWHGGEVECEDCGAKMDIELEYSVALTASLM